MSKYLSMRKGEIRDIDDSLAEKLIADGVAEEYNLIEPTGKITITENGSNIDVSQYAKADVNVSGGGGDFSTATVTFAITYSGQVSARVPVVSDAVNACVPFDVSVTSVDEPITATVVLYKGKCYAPIVDGLDAVATTGNVTYDSDNNALVITGDGTVTFSES